MPNHDLIAVWEEHLRSEFVAHDADAAMDTMVPDACVNHVPTMTGGVGHDEVKRFYKYHFVNAHPPDIEIIPVSRTVGTDSIVDEMIVKFTHTCVIDHLLPGIPPTGRSVEIPVVGVVQFRDGKLLRFVVYPAGECLLKKRRPVRPALCNCAAGKSFSRTTAYHPMTHRPL